MTDKELRTLDEMLTNLEIWSTWNKTFANEMIGICSKMRNLLANRKTENSSEKPNNCEDAENPSGDVWECGCFLDTYCEHQIYDRNPDGTINIVECGYEPKDEPTISKMEQVDEPQTPYDNCQSCLHWVYDGYWYCECNECRYEPKDEPQTDCAWK